MANKTIAQVVDMVHVAATNLGMDLSPEDIAFIISSFLQGVADANPTSQVDAGLLAIATEVDKTRNEL